MLLLWTARVMCTQSMETWSIWYIDEGFQILDYPLEVSISWIYLLSPYNWFCRFCTSHHLMPHSCSGVYAYNTIFKACFWFEFIDTRLLIPACHLEFITTLIGRVSDSPGFACLDPGAWSLWILPVADQRCAKEAWIIDRPSRALSFQAPCSSLEFFLL